MRRAPPPVVTGPPTCVSSCTRCGPKQRLDLQVLEYTLWRGVTDKDIRVPDPELLVQIVYRISTVYVNTRELKETVT